MDVNETLDSIRQQRAALAGVTGDDVPFAVIELLEQVGRLDETLSQGATLPVAWQNSRPYAMPDGCDAIGHVSKSHDGLNVEIDAPDDVRVTVHVNDLKAVDVVTGQPLPGAAPFTCAECGTSEADTYVVTGAVDDHEGRTEVCRDCDDALREDAAVAPPLRAQCDAQPDGAS